MTDRLETLLSEQRRFAPPPALGASANAGADIYERANADPLAFWADEARKLDWIRPFTEVLDWKLPHARWFADGRLNVSANCLDRHVATARRNKAAIIWEGEPGDRRVMTYWELAREVNPLALTWGL